MVMTTRPMSLGSAVRLTPEGRRTRAAEALGGQDVAVEWSELNDRWRVECESSRSAYAVLHQRMMERLMASDTAGTAVLMENADVVVHVPGPTELDRIEPMARLVLAIAALLPRFVVQDNPPLLPGATRRAVMALRAERRRGHA